MYVCMFVRTYVGIYVRACVCAHMGFCLLMTSHADRVMLDTPLSHLSSLLLHPMLCLSQAS